LYEDDGGTGDGNRTTTTTASSNKVVCSLKINITGGKGKGGEQPLPSFATPLASISIIWKLVLGNILHKTNNLD